MIIIDFWQFQTGKFDVAGEAPMFLFAASLEITHMLWRSLQKA